MSEVTAAIFRDGKVIEHVTLDASMPQYGISEFIWIEVLDPVDSDFAVLQERFGLHSLAVEDSMRPAQVPKIDVYDDQIFVVLKTARLEKDAIKYGEIDAFVSGHHIITVRHAADCGHAHAHETPQSGPKPTQVRPDFILHGILDFIVNCYFPVVRMRKADQSRCSVHRCRGQTLFSGRARSPHASRCHGERPGRCHSDGFRDK